MRNQAFSYSSLARSLQSHDFYKDKRLSNDVYRKQLIQKSLVIAENLFSGGITLNTILKNGKPTYYIPNLDEKIILRRCVRNIKDCLKIPIKNRNTIAKEAITYLKEGTAYNIFRLDIKAFFESISIKDVKNKLAEYQHLSTHTKNLINSYLSEFNKSETGIPRGVEISPIISEIVLKSFDDIVKSNTEVFYYARYVDDILIITSSDIDNKLFLNSLKKHLPENLQFNHNKKYIETVKSRTRSSDNTNGTVVSFFDFLGYEFKIIDTHLVKKTQAVHFRDIKIDITKSKLKKIKSKISKAIYNNYKQPNFDLLQDRIQFLTTNRNLMDKDKRRSIPIGLYYNNSVLGKNSPKLKELDCFLLKAIQASTNRFGKKIQHSLTNSQRKIILKISFERGFENRIYKRYCPNRLKEISKIWQ